MAGSFVAFGYSDGAVVVVDAAHDHRWEFIGHRAAATHIVIDAERRRVVSSARDELRIWELRPPAMSAAGALPCTPYHIMPTSDPGVFATDCSDGRALAWTPATGQVQTLHRHRDLAFGVAMYHGTVCTGGWDGRVLCTPASGGEPQEVLANKERIKVLVSCHDGLLLAATADGAVWRLDGTARILYRHRDMPYRLAIDDECRWAASGAYDGSLIVYDLADNRMVGELPHAHAGQVTQVVWQGNAVVTSGVDAAIRRWHVGARSVELSADTRESGPVAQLRTFTDGWVASVGERKLVMHSTGRHDVQLVLGRQITDIAISPDQQYVAVSDLDEVVVIDRAQGTIATAHNPASDIVCVRFISRGKIVTCDTSAILALSLDQLRFLTLDFGTGSTP